MCLWTLAVALRRSLQVTQTIPNARLRALYSPPSHKVCLPGGELERFEMRAWQVLAPSRRPLPCNRTCDRVLQLYLLSHLSLGRYRLRGYLKKLSTIYPRVFPEQKNRKGIDTRFFRTRPAKEVRSDPAEAPSKLLALLPPNRLPIPWPILHRH
jgi:hypothetical protein